jgi:hypothetical protein
MSKQPSFSQKSCPASLCATYKVAREGSGKLATVSPEVDQSAGSEVAEMSMQLMESNVLVFALMLTCFDICMSREEHQNTARAVRPLLRKLIKLPLSRVSNNQPTQGAILALKIASK